MNTGPTITVVCLTVAILIIAIAVILGTTYSLIPKHPEPQTETHTKEGTSK